VEVATVTFEAPATIVELLVKLGVTQAMAITVEPLARLLAEPKPVVEVEVSAIAVIRLLLPLLYDCFSALWPLSNEEHFCSWVL
jgi:hypothetical protein